MMVIAAEIGQRKKIHNTVKLDIVYLLKKARIVGNISIPNIIAEIKVESIATSKRGSFLLGLSI